MSAGLLVSKNESSVLSVKEEENRYASKAQADKVAGIRRSWPQRPVSRAELQDEMTATTTTKPEN